MYTTGIGSTRSSHFAANDTVAYLYRTLPRRCHTEDTTYVTITDNLTCLVENEVADVYGCSITVAVLGKRLVLHAVNDANETDTLEVRIVDDEVGDDVLRHVADVLKQELGTSRNTLSFWKCPANTYH